MGFVTVSTERGLAVAVATDTGGTKLVYLAGQANNQVGVSLGHVDEGGHDALDAQLEGAFKLSRVSRLRQRLKDFGLKRSHA